MAEPLKCVFVLSSVLDPGQALNCCSLLAVNLGAAAPELIGEGPVDADGERHSGLSALPISVLKASSQVLQELRSRAFAEPLLQHCFDVTTLSQRARKYEEVIEWTRAARASELEYVGLALVGP